jgi:hypothetical protein
MSGNRSLGVASLVVLIARVACVCAVIRYILGISIQEITAQCLHSASWFLLDPK